MFKLTKNCESNHQRIPVPALLIISLEIVHTRIILLHAHSQVVCCNCVRPVRLGDHMTISHAKPGIGPESQW